MQIVILPNLFTFFLNNFLLPYFWVVSKIYMACKWRIVIHLLRHTFASYYRWGFSSLLLMLLLLSSSLLLFIMVTVFLLPRPIAIINPQAPTQLLRLNSPNENSNQNQKSEFKEGGGRGHQLVDIEVIGRHSSSPVHCHPPRLYQAI